MRSEIYRVTKSEHFQGEAFRGPMRFANAVNENGEGRLGLVHTELETEIKWGEELVKSRKLGESTFDAIYVLNRTRREGLEVIDPKEGQIGRFIINPLTTDLVFEDLDLEHISDEELGRKSTIITPDVLEVLVIPNFVPSTFNRLSQRFEKNYLIRDFDMLLEDYWRCVI